MGIELKQYTDMSLEQYQKLAEVRFTGEVHTVVIFNEGGIRSGKITVIKDKYELNIRHKK